MNFLLKLRKPAVILILVLITLTAGRGLFSLAPLAGHDAAAYPVNQAQFMENLREGVMFPRWSPDTRYGYGQPQLQFRPPLLHYLASPIHAATGNPFLALHLALIGGLFMAAWGAYALARLRVGEWAALIAAAGFVCANYMLSNLYLRGAYYEVLAAAAMPWILWAQSRENVLQRRAFLIGPVAWAALLIAHPAVSFFFFPLTVVHALSEAFRARRWSIAGWSAVFLGLGVLLSAPYTWVMLVERSWIRMEIFLSNLDSWRRHFFSLREWFTERWPDAYAEYRGFDYLHRALHPEMRGLNFLAMAVLIFSPFVWWLTLRSWRRDKLGLRQPTTVAGLGEAGLGSTPPATNLKFPDVELKDNHYASAEKLFFAIFFYAAAWLSMAFSLRLSLPIWNHISVMDTFNYPWRVLNVTGLCLALATAYGVALLNDVLKQRGYRLGCVILIVLLVLGPLAEAVPYTGGWAGPAWLTREQLTPVAIRRHSGIPQQFYTPTWVQRYATEPALTDAAVIEGQATVTVTERRPTCWRLRVEAATPARIALSHYYYPGWRIYGLDKALETEPWGERGLISFAVPAGTHTLSARFGVTPARRAANGGFAVGLAFMLCGVLLPRRYVARHLTGKWPLGCRRGKPASFHAFLISACAVVLLVGAILLADYLVSARDDEKRAIQAAQQLAEGNNLAAIHSFARLLRERETDIAARYNLGAAYHNYGWHDEALASYDNVLNLADEYATKAAHSAARISVLRKDFENAGRYYEEALRHRPDAKDIRAEYEQLMLLRRIPGVTTKFETQN